MALSLRSIADPTRMEQLASTAHGRRRPWPIGVLLLAIASFLLAMSAAMLLTRRAAEAAARPPTAEDIARVEAKRAAIERLLSAPGQAVHADASLATSERYRRLQEHVAQLAQKGGATWSHIPTLLPVRQGEVSSPYALRFHPIRHEVLPHYGLDIAAPVGTPIYAAADGTVVAAGWVAGYGNAVDVDHGNGFVTRYAHASRLLVRTGDRVRRGQTIALVGSSGLATGPHLHYEVFRDGYSVDPAAFVLDGTASISVVDSGN